MHRLCRLTFTESACSVKFCRKQIKSRTWRKMSNCANNLRHLKVKYTFYWFQNQFSVLINKRSGVSWEVLKRNATWRESSSETSRGDLSQNSNQFGTSQRTNHRNQISVTTTRFSGKNGLFRRWDLSPRSRLLLPGPSAGATLSSPSTCNFWF